jgi:hemolysin III
MQRLHLPAPPDCSAVHRGAPWNIVSFSIYAAGPIFQYLLPALYQSMHHAGKAVFLRLDHLAIYLLLAGTFTPFPLVTLRGQEVWSSFGLIWGLTVLGIVLEVFVRKGRQIVPVVVDLMNGWLIIFALKSLLAAMTIPGFT